MSTAAGARQEAPDTIAGPRRRNGAAMNETRTLAEFVAGLRGTGLERVAEFTGRNYRNLFGAVAAH